MIIAIALVPTLSPWLGFGARLMRENKWNIACIGAVLWVASCAAIWFLHRLPDIKGKRNLGVSILVWTLVFVPLFISTAVATDFIIRR